MPRTKKTETAVIEAPRKQVTILQEGSIPSMPKTEAIIAHYEADTFHTTYQLADNRRNLSWALWNNWGANLTNWSLLSFAHTMQHVRAQFGKDVIDSKSNEGADDEKHIESWDLKYSIQSLGRLYKMRATAKAVIKGLKALIETAEHQLADIETAIEVVEEISEKALENYGELWKMTEISYYDADTKEADHIEKLVANIDIVKE